MFAAVQNERDRISCRRPSYEENNPNNGLSVSSLLTAELHCRQAGIAPEVCLLKLHQDNIEPYTQNQL